MTREPSRSSGVLDPGLGERAAGVVYTPAAVAAELVAHALPPIVEPLVAARDVAGIRALRVCDPAVGKGAIAVAIVDYLASAIARADAAGRGGGIACPAVPRARANDAGRTGESASGAEPCVRADDAGCIGESASRAELRVRTKTNPDLDDAASRSRTDAAARARADAERCIVGMDVDARAIAVARARVPGATLREGDALAAVWEPVDAVIANPPYIRGERIANKAALAGFAVYDATADLYVYFVELAHRIVKPGGRYAIIVPQKWMTAAYGRRTRALLAPTVHGVVDASEFPDADAFPCIVWGATAPAAAPALVATHRGVRARAQLGDDPWHLDAPPAAALIDRLARAFPPLESVIAGKPQRGVVTGCNAAFVVDRAVRDALIAADPANATLVRPLVKGRDLVRERGPDAARPDLGIERRDLVPGRIAPAHERFVLLIDHGTQPTPSILAHLARFRAQLEPGGPGGRKPGRYRWYELQDPLNHMLANPAPRLLYQDIQTQPIAALDDGSLVPDTTVWMLPTADPWIQAILSSPLYAFYARHRFPPALNGSVRPKWEYLRHLPIAPAAAGFDLASNAAEAVAAAYALTATERRLVVKPSTSNNPIPTTSAISATLKIGHR